MYSRKRAFIPAATETVTGTSDPVTDDSDPVTEDQRTDSEREADEQAAAARKPRGKSPKS